MVPPLFGMDDGKGCAGRARHIPVTMCSRSQRLCNEAGERMHPLDEACQSPPHAIFPFYHILLLLDLFAFYSDFPHSGFPWYFRLTFVQMIGKEDDSVASWLAQKGCAGSDTWSHIPFMRNALSAGDDGEGDIVEPLLREGGRGGRGGSTRRGYKDPFGSKEIAESNGTVFSRRRCVRLSRCIFPPFFHKSLRESHLTVC